MEELDYQKELELNPWFIGDNEISTSVNQYYVRITFCPHDTYIYYQLEVFDQNKAILPLIFYSLNDAKEFTDKIISKCTTKEEILKYYSVKLENGEFKTRETEKYHTKTRTREI